MELNTITSAMITYAGLRADDPRGQWNTADFAQFLYSHSDVVEDYERIAPDTTDYRIIRADDATAAVAIEYNDDDTVDGITYTLYDSEGDECSTGGHPVTVVEDLARAASELLVWAAEA